MSIRAVEFARVITNPLNIYNFEVKIPGFDYAMIVESTTFPAEQSREMKLTRQGEDIYYRAKPVVGGKWNVKVPENDDGKVRYSMEKLIRDAWEQKSGALRPEKWLDIDIFARDQADNIVFHSVLHGCWLQQRNSVSLNTADVTSNWAWDFQFVYCWIEDKVKLPTPWHGAPV